MESNNNKINFFVETTNTNYLINILISLTVSLFLSSVLYFKLHSLSYFILFLIVFLIPLFRMMEYILTKQTIYSNHMLFGRIESGSHAFFNFWLYLTYLLVMFVCALIFIK